MDTDVLVVGAGPTGLMLANQLARRGVRAMIIDRHAGPSLQTRALGVQARTLEIYARLGIVDRALELGRIATGANLWADGRKTARVPLGTAGKALTPYPYILVLGQDDNERLLADRLREQGVSVTWRTELQSIEQQSGHVATTLKGPDGRTREVRAAWIAGCDGARSAVRELNGIGFPGAPYEHVFFVADVVARGRMVSDEVNVFLWKQGFHLFFPMRGSDHWRIVGILPAGLRDAEHIDFDAILPSVREALGEGFAVESCAWFSTYRIHHRAAARFRDQRCFLLGDAAHIHSPVGAQGMNTGLQDAYNLGWKLALVVEGHADASLLDSYEAERLPVARRLLNTTDRAFRVVVSDHWLAGLVRTQLLARVAAFAMRRDGIQRLAFRVVSQTGIHYRSSGLSQALPGLPAGAPQAGDRFPWLKLNLEAGGPVEDLFRKLDDNRFQLLLFGQSQSPGLAAQLGDHVGVVVVPGEGVNAGELARAGIPQPSFYLVRPDGHVGLCGVRVDAATLSSYLNERLRIAIDAGMRNEVAPLVSRA